MGKLLECHRVVLKLEGRLGASFPGRMSCSKRIIASRIYLVFLKKQKIVSKTTTRTVKMILVTKKTNLPMVRSKILKTKKTKLPMVKSKILKTKKTKLPMVRSKILKKVM